MQTSDNIVAINIINLPKLENNDSKHIQVARYISSADKHVLMSKRYRIPLPKNFSIENTRFTREVSVLDINGDGQYEIAVRTNNIIPVDPKDSKAISTIQSIIRASELCMNKFDITDGNCLILNNNRTLHSRDAFSGERIVLRAYVRNNLDHLREHA